MKTCTKCKISKPLDAFGKNKSNKDGLQYRCKVCRIDDAAAYFKKLPDEEKQKRREATTEWKKKNKSRLSGYQTKWYELNRGKRTSYQNKRKAQKLLRTPKWLTEADLHEIQLFYVMAAELETIFPWKQHVDHIVPLQGKTVSGLHVPWNLQILSAKANIEKGNRYYG
jgi:5-methylcytosine-specific restriction endonuclease McrA